MTAPDAVRVASIRQRDQTFVQTTDKDIVNKGKEVVKRISDTFTKYADTINFFFRGGVEENAVLAATWTRFSRQEEGGNLHIIDQVAYDALKATHNTTVRSLEIAPEEQSKLLWENAVERISTISLRPAKK